MIQKESLSDDALMHFSSMDKYLVNSANPNQTLMQKQMNQNINVPQLNVAYMNNNEGMTEEHLRARNCFNINSVNQTQYNHMSPQYNRMPLMVNSSPANTEKLSMFSLYRIASNYPDIERLTLPVDGGDLFGPFILPVDQILFEIEFNLSDDSLKQIILREDLDIVLLSKFNKENAFKFLSWPSSIKISVNDNLLSLDTTSFNRIPLHVPQFIKTFCLPGRNVIKFEMYEIPRFNIQMFLFNVYMVHRPTVLYSRKITIENALVYEGLTIKLLQSNCLCLEKDYVNISALCPISNKRIEIPIRFKNCDHLQPFDLMSFLKMEARWMFNICPLCYKTMHFNFKGYQQNIVIDVILQDMFEKMPPGCDMLKVDSDGRYTPFCSNPPLPNGGECVQMMHQHQRGPPFHDMGGGSGSVMMSSPQMRPSLPPGMYHRYLVSDPSMMMNGGGGGAPYMTMQSPQYQQHLNQRLMMNPHLVSPTTAMMVANRSMLDFNPYDPSLHHTGGVGTGPISNQSPTKKTTKRKPAAKKSRAASSVVSTVSDPPMVVSMASSRSVTCPATPPSTRTSSVASTSSPDSINVPYSSLKRSPSLDHLSHHVLAESHLNDELLLYSSASATHHTKSIFTDELTPSLPTVSLPQMSSSSSFSQPSSNYFSATPFSQSTIQNHLPEWTDVPDSQLFSKHYQSPSTTAPPPSSSQFFQGSEPTIHTFSQQAPCSNRSQDTSHHSHMIDPYSCVSRYVDDILANHEPVPEIDDCDWLNEFDLDSIDRQINGLSDIEGF